MGVCTGRGGGVGIIMSPSVHNSHVNAIALNILTISRDKFSRQQILDSQFYEVMG